MLTRRIIVRSFSIVPANFEANLKELILEEGRTTLHHLQDRYSERFNTNFPNHRGTLGNFLRKISGLKVIIEGSTAFVEASSCGPRKINDVSLKHNKVGDCLSRAEFWEANLKELILEEGRTPICNLHRKYTERFNTDFPKHHGTLGNFLRTISGLKVTKEGSTAFVEALSSGPCKISDEQLKHNKVGDGLGGLANEPEIIELDAQLQRFQNDWYAGETAVAIDCEGVPSNLYLVQVATQKKTFIFDTVKLAPERVCQMLQPLLEDTNVVKLLHDLRCDAIAFRNFGGIEEPKALLDTQLVMERLTGKFNHGINTTLMHFKQGEHPEKKEMAKLMKNAGDDSIFKDRPLSDQVISYAANDVRLLRNAYSHIRTEVNELAMIHLTLASIARYKQTKRHQVKRPIVFEKTSSNIVSKELQFYGIASVVDTPIPTVESDTAALLDILPDDIQNELLRSVTKLNELVDIILDFGRQPLTYCGSTCIPLFDSSDRKITREDLDYVVQKVGGFGVKGRACLDGQLHRISAVYGREQKLIGVTIRFGRQITNLATKIHDILFADPSKSILITGNPGTGKTSLIRDMARLLSDHYRTCIVDTSNEIAGDGDVPHSCIGRLSRRFMVDSVYEQADKMIEVVQNHTPEVLFLDEIGTFAEARSAAACRNRGVRLISSTHGNLESIVKNPDLQALVGGLQKTIISDGTLEKMTTMGRDARKVRLERAGDPIFDIIVDLRKGFKNDCWITFDSALAVDRVLQGEEYRSDRRSQDPDSGQVFHEMNRRGGHQMQSIPYSSTSTRVSGDTEKAH